MKGVADFVLAVLHYSQGEYSVEEIEDLILLIEAYEDEKDRPPFTLITMPMADEYDD